jgi:probable HAF family extracellular repeat protein
MLGVSLAASAQSVPQFRVVDLGTNVNAAAINNKAQVVGTRAVNGVLQPFLYDRSFHDLGFAGFPASVNNRGVIAGTDCSDGTCRAFVYDGRVTTLFPGQASSTATGINDNGAVAGTMTVSGGVHGFLWQSGASRDLGALLPSAINSGSHLLAASGGGSVLYSGGATQPLPGTAQSLNDSDVVAGVLPVPGSPYPQPYTWSKGISTPLAPYGLYLDSRVLVANNGWVAATYFMCFMCPAWTKDVGVLYVSAAPHALNDLLQPADRGTWWVAFVTAVSKGGTILARAYFQPSYNTPLELHTVELLPVAQ